MVDSHGSTRLRAPFGIRKPPVKDHWRCTYALVPSRCTGLTDVDLKFGTCWYDDPCAADAHTCRPDERCVPARQVCLSMLKKYCVQYKCGKTPDGRALIDERVFYKELTVSDKNSCEDATKSPVCDTDGEEHVNLCHLLRADKTLAYSGPCLVSVPIACGRHRVNH